MAPVYLVGLDRGDPWYKQTAYSLDSPHLITAAAGDPVRPVVRIANNRSEPLSCQIGLSLPDGWKADRSTVSVSVAPGEASSVELPITIALDETIGFKEAVIVVSEGREIKRIPLKVLVQSPLTMQVSPMAGRPGKTRVTVTVGNHSAKRISGTMVLHIPASWRAITPEISITGLAPGETRPVACEFEWGTDWKPGESATVELDLGAGRKLSRPLIPCQNALHRARDITLDGRLDDWQPETRWPAWLLGSTAGDPNATAHLAWAPEGLYGAVEVHDSKLQVSDPGSFWAMDALELFLDTADSKQPRTAGKGDHQFWLLPLPDENRVYLGQWKMKDEIAATRFDLPTAKGAAAHRGWLHHGIPDPGRSDPGLSSGSGQSPWPEPQPDDPGQAGQPRSLLARPQEFGIARPPRPMGDRESGRLGRGYVGIERSTGALTRSEASV